MSGIAPVQIASGDLTAQPAVAALGTWTFKLRQQTISDFQSLKSSQIGDLILQIDFHV